jgi:hypothetical protein
MPKRSPEELAKAEKFLTVLYVLFVLVGLVTGVSRYGWAPSKWWAAAFPNLTPIGTKADEVATEETGKTPMVNMPEVRDLKIKVPTEPSASGHRELIGDVYNGNADFPIKTLVIALGPSGWQSGLSVKQRAERARKGDVQRFAVNVDVSPLSTAPFRVYVGNIGDDLTEGALVDFGGELKTGTGDAKIEHFIE